MPPLAESEAFVRTSHKPRIRAAPAPAVENIGEKRLQRGMKAIAAASASRTTTATHKAGSSAAPEVLCGVTITGWKTSMPPDGMVLASRGAHSIFLKSCRLQMR